MRNLCRLLACGVFSVGLAASADAGEPWGTWVVAQGTDLKAGIVCGRDTTVVTEYCHAMVSCHDGPATLLLLNVCPAGKPCSLDLVINGTHFPIGVAQVVTSMEDDAVIVGLVRRPKLFRALARAQTFAVFADGSLVADLSLPGLPDAIARVYRACASHAAQ